MKKQAKKERKIAEAGENSSIYNRTWATGPTRLPKKHLNASIYRDFGGGKKRTRRMRRNRRGSRKTYR
jgi:hypothetical protein